MKEEQEEWSGGAGVNDRSRRNEGGTRRSEEGAGRGELE